MTDPDKPDILWGKYKFFVLDCYAFTNRASNGSYPGAVIGKYPGNALNASDNDRPMAEFLGVRAEVTELDAQSNQIRVSLTVGKPESCDDRDWEQILQNLNQGGSRTDAAQALTALTPRQEMKLQRLLAYMIQVGDPNEPINWEVLQPQLELLGFSESMLLGMRSAARVPQSLDQLVEGLDPDLAAIALSKAVGIALLDRRVNSMEDKALSVLLEAMKQQTSKASR